MKFALVFTLLLVSANAFNSPLYATRAVGKAPATKAVAAPAPKKKFSFGKKAAPKAVAEPSSTAPKKKSAPKKKDQEAPAPKKKFSFGKKAVAEKPSSTAPKKKSAPKKKVAVKKVAVKKVAVKKAAPKKKAVVVKKAPIKAKKSFQMKDASASKAPPASKGYPSFAAKAQNFKLGKGRISGGAAGKEITPVFIHPTVNNEPAPSFDYKEAAKARKTPQTQDYVYDDGLTVIERKQSKTIPAFLTGSARSRVEAEAPRDDIEEQLYPFGLSGDRFQLLFITLFSLFTLVGSLSGAVQLD